MLSKKGWTLFGGLWLLFSLGVVLVSTKLIEREKNDIQYNLGALGYSALNIGISIAETASDGPSWYARMSCSSLSSAYYSDIRKRAPNNELSSVRKSRDEFALRRLLSCEDQVSEKAIGEAFQTVRRQASLDTIRAINEFWMEFSGSQDSYRKYREETSSDGYDASDKDVIRLFDPWPFIVKGLAFVMAGALVLFLVIWLNERFRRSQ